MWNKRHSMAQPKNGSKTAPCCHLSDEKRKASGQMVGASNDIGPGLEIWAGHLQSHWFVDRSATCLGFAWDLFGDFFWKVSPISRNYISKLDSSNSPTQDIKWLKWDKSQRQVTTGVLFVAPPVDHPMLGFPDDMLTFFVDVGLHWALNEV
jgi:hypothetical protein